MRSGVDNASRAAFTIIELMIVVALVGVLAGLGSTNYFQYVEKARVARAISEINSLATVLSGLAIDEDSELPDSLAEIGHAGSLDPWGNPYQYLRIEGNLPSGMTSTGDSLPDVAASPDGGGGGGSPVAPARKDRFLVPINSDFDLYSMGPDGRSLPSLQAPVSRDDVIRAANGAFIGVAERF